MLTIGFEELSIPSAWMYLFKCLKAYNFGPKLISHTRTLYTDITSKIANNGHISNWFPLKLGVRQGCPVCPYLFKLDAEAFSTKIRTSKDIKGIIINDLEIKITQLTDDTTCSVVCSAAIWKNRMLFWIANWHKENHREGFRARITAKL